MTVAPALAFVRPAQTPTHRPWAAIDLGAWRDCAAKLHWADAPFHWHRDGGPELFVVLSGEVDMHYRDAAGEHVERMATGDVCRIEAGTWHVAAPIGAAHVLVVEPRSACASTEAP